MFIFFVVNVALLIIVVDVKICLELIQLKFFVHIFVVDCCCLTNLIYFSFNVYYTKQYFANILSIFY